MTLADVGLLGKKILVGVIVTLVPFSIIFTGLWFTPRLLSKVDQNKHSKTTPTTKPK